MHGGKRSRNALATAPVQYRARMTRTDPVGEESSWFEGPYPNPAQANGRITFWKRHYQNNPERKGWHVRGQREKAQMEWRADPG